MGKLLSNFRNTLILSAVLAFVMIYALVTASGRTFSEGDV